MEPNIRRRIHQWMLRLADGDRSAFEPLFSTLLPVLEAFARRLLNHEDEARDVAQSSLLQVFSRASEFDRRRDAVNWILGITAYQCRTARKRQQRRREVDQGEAALESVAGMTMSVEERLVKENLQASVHTVLGTLRPADIETIRIALGEERRPEMPAATYRKRLQRALGRLKVAWRMKYGSP